MKEKYQDAIEEIQNAVNGYIYTGDISKDSLENVLELVSIQAKWITNTIEKYMALAVGNFSELVKKTGGTTDINDMNRIIETLNKTVDNDNHIPRID